MRLTLRNIGPKTATWLRMVGVHSAKDLAALGAVQTYVKVRRAGFKPGINLLYMLEGALTDCHWQQIPEHRRAELVQAAEAALAQLPPPRGRPAAAPVTTTYHDEPTAPTFTLFDDEHAGDTDA